MGTLYIDTGGAATNSGSTDQNAANLSGTGDATVAGSVVTLTAGTDLSGVVTSGATQSTIYLAQATNTNQKIFWITATAGSGGATPNVTVSVAPTGVTGSNWAIGGRHVYTGASIQAALRAGDEVIFNNSPASFSADAIVQAASGDATSGFIRYTSKSGVRAAITVTNTTQCVDVTSGFLYFKGFEFVQQGASGEAVRQQNAACIGNVFDDCKVSLAGGDGYGTTAGNGCRWFGGEITGCGAQGSNSNCARLYLGLYIHDNAGAGLVFGSATVPCDAINCILDTNAVGGIVCNAAPSSPTNLTIMNVIGCTVYGCADSGLRVDDKDTVVNVFSSIFSQNGNQAGEYNCEFIALAAEALGVHYNNVFYHTGGGGGANLLNLTANSTESTSDPLFTNPASGDFSLQTGSPALATGFPTQYLGGNANYLDMGAVQKQLTAAAARSSALGGQLLLA